MPNDVIEIVVKIDHLSEIWITKHSEQVMSSTQG